MRKISKLINKNILSLLFSIIAAVGMWSYVTYVENPDMTRWIKNVSVTVSGAEQLSEKGFSVATMSHDKIDIKVRAKRNQFKYLSPESITAIADVSRISRTGEAVINVSVSLPSSTPNATVIDRRRNSITFTVDNLSEAQFDIEVDIGKEPTGGYYVYSTSYDRESAVTVSGAKAAVKEVVRVATEPIDLSGASSNIITPAALIAYDSSGKAVNSVTISAERVNVTVELYKNKTVPVELICRSLNSSLLASLTEEEVTVTGPAALIDAIGSVSTKPLDCSNAVPGGSIYAALDLPNSVTLAEGQSGSLEVTFTSTQPMISTIQ